MTYNIACPGGCYSVIDFHHVVGVEGAGLVLWVGGPPDASFGLYLREAFQSQASTENILYNECHWPLICYKN